MVSQQIIDIIIKAEDRASQQAKKVEEKFKGLGDTTNKAMDNASKASEKLNDTLGKTNESLSVVGGGAVQATQQLQQIQLNPNLGSTIDRAKLKVSQMGYSLDTVKGKFKILQTAGSTVWDNIKNKASSTAQIIKWKVGGALDNIKRKTSSAYAEFKKLTNAAKESGAGLGFLRNAASMAAGMIGVDLLYGIVDSGREALNAQNKFDYFGKRLELTGAQTQEYTNQINSMQKEFRKVDMTAVGASAEEMAVKYGLAYDSLDGLTRATTVMSSQFVKEGRTQEDSILAVSDALDGQFKRLQEIGITQDILKNNGWNGDINDKKNLLDALNKTMKDMGFEQTAKDITSLEDAFTALNVAGGAVLRAIIIPITPFLIQIAYGFLSVADSVQSFITGLQNAWNGLPDWVKYAIEIAAVAVAVGIVIAAFGGLQGILISVATAIAPFIGAIMAISWPVVAVVAAIGLLVVAIYEIGKAFGWWTDVSSMLSHIQAGVMRLWNAFINHPDVQAVISAISGALSWLAEGIGWTINQVMKFFGISTGSKWDIVASIIHGIGDAWNGLRPYLIMAIGALQSLFGFLSSLVGTAVGIGQGIYNALKPIVCILLGCSPGIVPALRKVYEVFLTVWNAIVSFVSGIISQVVSALQPVIDILSLIGEFIIGQFMESWNALVTIIQMVWSSVSQVITIFSMFLSGQMSLSTALAGIWNVIQIMFGVVLNLIIQRVISFGSSLVQLAIRAGLGFVVNIIQYIQRLPGRVLTYLVKTAGNIVAQTTKWVNTAKSKASQLVIGVINYLKSLPGKVYSYLHQVVSKIINVGQQWVNAAKQKAKSIVDGVGNVLSGTADRVKSALNGVKDAIVKPFKDGYNSAKKIWDDITSLGNSTAAGFDLNAAGFELDETTNIYKELNQQGTEEYNLNINMNGDFSFENLPEGVSEDDVADIVINYVTSEEYMKKLTSSKVFQSLDAKIKARMVSKNKRARGV